MAWTPSVSQGGSLLYSALTPWALSTCGHASYVAVGHLPPPSVSLFSHFSTWGWEYLSLWRIMKVERDDNVVKGWWCHKAVSTEHIFPGVSWPCGTPTEHPTRCWVLWSGVLDRDGWNSHDGEKRTDSCRLSYDLCMQAHKLMNAHTPNNQMNG